MNFFKRQAEARRYTVLLIAYLLIAVTLIVLAVNAVVYVALAAGSPHSPDISSWRKMQWWPLITAGTLLVITVGSLFRWLTLRSGGHAVAELMHARPVSVDSVDPLERRFINVVEEMSIASGTPVPDLYVMDQENGINAFVAGYQPTEAVMVVTRGALEVLSRDELQGVVGHEFSHVLNGDMRINIRLIAILAGILTLGVLGRLMMRSLGRSSRVRRSSGGRAARAQLIAFALGLGLFLIGYIGLFFGRLIKAAVSRQREFLADASSVQFTRNPRGIAGALWKIKTHAQGALLSNDHAEETSHMCFGQNMKMSFAGLMATHPPIDERIRRVDPHFEAKRAAERMKARVATVPGAAAGEKVMGFAPFLTAAVAAGTDGLTASVGNPTPEHVDYATAFHRSIPQALLKAMHAPREAPFVVYALLLGGVAEERGRVARALIRHETETADDVRLAPICDAVGKLDLRYRLPLLDLATPALRGLSEAEREAVIEIAEKLVRIDRKVKLFEFVLLTLLKKRLKRGPSPGEKIRYRRFAPVLPEIRILLTLMSRAGARNARQSEDAYARAMGSFTKIGLAQADEVYCRLESMEAVLTRLSGLSPLLKGSLISACADCVLHDG
ncbi:MAG TPA: M48 family metallopeptidase, partial [Gammaproteobacteria bacterium]|nr:M48 family metallopeptidase [Gammaproteobacteria bacterium]